MTEVRRRSTLPVPAAPGAGWEMVCPTCNQGGVTRAGGRCPHCGDATMETLPALVGADSLPGVLDSKLVWGLVCFLVATLPVSPFVLFSGDPLWGLLFAPVFYVMMYPISLPFFFLARSMWRKRIPKLVDGNRTFTDLVPVEKAWYEITKLRGRRGLVVHLAFRVSYLQGKQVEVTVRFRGPQGFYIPATLRNYRGDLGELRVRYISKPVKNRLASFPNVWLFLPIRAMGLPPGTSHVRLTAEILLSCEGTVHTERDLPIDFKPFPEDFPHALPPGRAAFVDPLLEDRDDGAIEILEARGVPREDAHCGVCGDPFGADVVRCSLCETPHHAECWSYMGGCTTYACEGRPLDG